MRNYFPALIFAVSLLLPDRGAAAETSRRSEWERIVAAAEKEGQLVIYLGGAA